MKIAKKYILILIIQTLLICIKLEGKFETVENLLSEGFKACPEYCDDFDLSKSFRSKADVFLSKTIFKNTKNEVDVAALLEQIQRLAQINKKFYENKENWVSQAGFPLPAALDLAIEEQVFNARPKASFLQKVILKKDDEIFLMGDIHGSVHTLWRSLGVLFLRGYLYNDFKLKPNFYMIFLGDYGDRGWYSFETWFTLLKLKEVNPEHVFLVRGNHEAKEIAVSDAINHVGFLAIEIQKIEGNNQKLLKKQFLNLFEHLPAAIYLEYKDKFIQCNHGGIAGGINQSVWPFEFTPQKDLPELLSKAIAPKTLEQITLALNYNLLIDQYFYIDFKDGLIIGMHGETILNLKTGSLPANLNAVFRGHNHNSFGLKLYPRTAKDISNKLTPEEKGKYPATAIGRGGLYWKHSLPEREDNSFKINHPDIVPIFTLSASSGDILHVPYDCFCILKIGETLSESILNVYEKELKNRPSGQYVSIKKEGKNDISLEYSLVEPTNPTGDVFLDAVPTSGLDGSLKTLQQSLTALKQKLTLLERSLSELTQTLRKKH